LEKHTVYLDGVST